MTHRPRQSPPPDAGTRRAVILATILSVLATLVAAFAKYAAPPRGYVVDPANWSSSDGGIWAITPRIAFGWSSFPADATRWRFDHA